MRARLGSRVPALLLVGQCIEVLGSLKQMLAALAEACPTGNFSARLGALAILSRLGFRLFRHGVSSSFRSKDGEP